MAGNVEFCKRSMENLAMQVKVLKIMAGNINTILGILTANLANSITKCTFYFSSLKFRSSAAIWLSVMCSFNFQHLSSNVT